MADKEEILLEIIVSNDKATQAIFESQQSIEKLKQSQKDLTEEKKKGTLTEEEYSKKMTAAKVAISQQNEVIRLNEKELKNNIKSQKDNSDSLAALRAQLSNSTKAYDNLSKAERESAKGQDLQKSISETIEQLNEAEQATGRFQRQVGKYPEQMGGAGKGINQVTGFLGKMSDQVSVISPKFGGMISQFGGFASKASSASESLSDMNINMSQSGDALNAVEGFAGKATGSLDDLATTSAVAGKTSTSAFSSIASGAKALGTVFLTPPIIIIAAVIGAIVAAFKLLQLGFERNDAASDKMAESLAVLEPILDFVSKIAGEFAGAIAELVSYLVEGIATMIDFTASLFGVSAGFSEAANEAKRLVQAQDEIENSERDYIINSAKRNKERAKLLAEVADKEKNNADKRVAYLKDALELDEQELAEKKRIAQLKFILAVDEAKRTVDTNIETQKKIAQLNADAINAETAYFEGKKEINKKLSAAENELAAEQQANFDKWKKNKDEQINKETQLLRQLEDLAIEQIKNELQRQIEAERVKTERANADLLKRLKTEENLTAKSKQAINDIILLNEKNLVYKINELNDKSLEENIRKELESKQKSLEAQLQLSEKGSQDELKIKLSKLILERDAVLLNDELTNVQRLAIEDKFNKDSDALNDAYLIGRQQRLKESFDKEFQLRFLNAENNNIAIEEQKAIELERAILEAENLKNLDAETKAAMFQTQLDYEIAIAQSQQNIITAQENVTAAQLTSLLSFNTAMTNISQSIGTIISNLADDSYEAAQFQRALAIFNIGIALSESIAGVTKMAATRSITVFDMLATILAGTASVATSIAGAKKAFNDSPIPKKPAFASGGLISGRGTGTSDSIDARVSNGESIINANSTAMFTPLLSSLNQAGGGVGFGNQQINNQLQGEEMLARAFAKGAAMIPPNMLTLKEFHAANDRYISLKEQ
jgi:hypothetical protein